jgi:glycosyltransferase involved in cell wall biosynthesis
MEEGKTLRRSVCHLSVLNPAIHTRIFYKLALSQAEAGYLVSIIAQDKAPSAYERSGVRIVPQKPFHRLSIRRLTAPLRLFRLAHREKADIYFLHTPELLFTGLLLRLFLPGVALVYDVHEDYRQNFLSSGVYPGIIRGFAGRLIRFWERMAVRFLDAVSYAELNYDNMLRVPDRKKWIIRNTFTEKAAESDPNPALPAGPFMLYTGTLSENRGIFQTLSLWVSLHKIRPVKLVMAGVTFSAETIGRIRDFVAKQGLDTDFMLIGGTDYVPYADLLELLRRCHFGTALYDHSLSGRMPTKFFEFMAFGKPLIFSDDPYWNEMNRKLGFGFSFSKGVEAAAVWEAIDSFVPVARPDDYGWERDANILLKMLSSLTKRPEGKMHSGR